MSAKGAIIGGTGVYELPGARLKEQTVDTPFGKATVHLGEGELADIVFVARHGTRHSVPPHKVNYRANLMALYQLNVNRALGVYTVGSVRDDLPPGGMVALSQFVDLTHGRPGTFFDGDGFGVAHTDMTEPYCPTIRKQLVTQADEAGLSIRPQGTYFAFDGPRLETAAEIRMCSVLGGDVVGMTAVPEAQLAREAGIHFGGIAISVNYAAGIRGDIKIERSGMEANLAKLLDVLVDVLRNPVAWDCRCELAVDMFQRPEIWDWHGSAP